jgi:phage head maturation protease
MAEAIVHSREVVLERRESPEQGAYRATIFVNERARQGPDLDIAGLQLENYMRNPVVLWSHDMSGRTESAGLPIGRTNRMTNTDGKIEVDFEFLADDSFAERVRNAWDKGFLQAASVSWLPLESEQGEDGNQRDIRSDLLEWSIVSVPSDPDAVRQAHSRMMEGLLTEEVDDNNIDEKIRQRQEEEEEGDEPEAETKPEPCWEANEDCVIRAALKEHEDAEESQEPETEESSANTERLLSIARDISRKLRRGA